MNIVDRPGDAQIWPAEGESGRREQCPHTYRVQMGTGECEGQRGWTVVVGDKLPGPRTRTFEVHDDVTSSLSPLRTGPVARIVLLDRAVRVQCAYM